MDDFFNIGSMLQNIVSEIFGILVTVIVIDTLYEYRQQIQQNEYLQSIITRVREIVSNAETLAFGVWAQEYLGINTITMRKHAVKLVGVLGNLQKYNREIEAFIAQYSILTTPSLVHELHQNISVIDEKLKDIAFILDWQINDGPLQGDKSLPDPVARLGLEYEDILRSTYLVPTDKQSIATHYEELRILYDALEKTLDRFASRRVNFFRILTNDSLLSSLIPRKRKENKSSVPVFENRLLYLVVGVILLVLGLLSANVNYQVLFFILTAFFFFAIFRPTSLP